MSKSSLPKFRKKDWSSDGDEYESRKNARETTRQQRKQEKRVKRENAFSDRD